MTAKNGDTEAQLAAWLPAQRWFPGRGTRLDGTRVVSDVKLAETAADHARYADLRHLIVEADLPSGPARFQVLLAARPAGGFPPALRAAVIGSRDGLVTYDALHDPGLTGLLLAWIDAGRQTGPLRFTRAPGSPDLSGLTAGRLLGAEQSNTSVVFGDRVILKVFRRLFAGPNPDLEVASALAGLGSAAVPAPCGWIEADTGGEPVQLAVASQFLAGAPDGWTLALAAVAAGRSFADEARLLGQATAALHAGLAQAFGSQQLTGAELAGLAAGLHGRLTDAVAEVPALRPHEARLRAAYDAAAAATEPAAVQRIHGDYHLGQVLRGPGGWVALDFEGEPGIPLELRRAPGPALRDVAGMLRSFDYAARHQQAGAGHGGDGGADAWRRECQDSFCSGYAAGGGTDPVAHGALLAALTLDKAVYEVVYEYRHRPAWLSIPLEFVAGA